MPKMKSNRGAMKRFRKSGTGKIRRQHAYCSHILTKMSRKRKRNLRKVSNIAAVDLNRVRRMIVGS